MNKIIILLLATLFFISCKSYENKNKYTVGVGKVVEIYYSTNSCCYYCFSNEKNLIHSKLLDRKTLDDGPDDCVGCNHTAAFIFKAKSIGIDTIKLKHVTATEDCDSSDVQPEIYVIEVK